MTDVESTITVSYINHDPYKRKKRSSLTNVVSTGSVPGRKQQPSRRKLSTYRKCVPSRSMKNDPSSSCRNACLPLNMAANIESGSLVRVSNDVINT